MNKTIFCDIDGTLVKHHGGLGPISVSKPVALPNVLKYTQGVNLDLCKNLADYTICLKKSSEM